nr:hypothetical protein BgiMline_006908 [Biomphalaria glabrata]
MIYQQSPPMIAYSPSLPPPMITYSPSWPPKRTNQPSLPVAFKDGKLLELTHTKEDIVFHLQTKQNKTSVVGGMLKAGIFTIL